jgi:hypothetical protein
MGHSWSFLGRFCCRRVLITVLLLIASGCTIENYGATAARVSKSETAIVYDVYALGGQVRTRTDDAGLSLGYTKRSYVFAVPSEGGPSEGWHYFHVPLPDRPALALHLVTVGLARISQTRRCIGALDAR